MTDAKQVTLRTHEHGKVHAQLEQFPVPDDTAPTGRKVPHLSLQPLKGGPAHRYPLDSPEAKELLEDHPELQALLEA